MNNQPEAAPPPSDKDLQKPIEDKGDAGYQMLANEAGRRVWVVLQNLIEVRARGRQDNALHGVEVNAVLLGAMSGIACHVARMNITVEGAGAGETPPEILMLNDLGTQFLHTIDQMRASDPMAMLMAKPEGGEEAKAS